MAWSPRYVDRPLRFLYDPETWALCFVVLGIAVVFGINQVIAMAIAVIIGWFLQRIVDRHTRGYILHLMYSIGILKIFPPFGKYRF
ncbi:MAG: hypothetical protein IBX72_11340 [Nitrospirae bacterium]|nr:hypothetical protein [Nitrospirota bacterium]